MPFLLLKKESLRFLISLSCVLALSCCTVHQKRFFCIELFNWDLEEVFVVRTCQLRTVRYIEDFLIKILYETSLFLRKCLLEGGVC